MKKSWGTILVATLMTTALISGCGSDVGKSAVSSPGTSASKAPETPTSIKAMAILFGDPPATQNNKGKEDFEKRGNVKLDIEFVPSDAYPDKLNVAIASNASYDLILFPDGKNDRFANLVKQGAFYDLTPYLKGKKNLEFTPKEVWAGTSIQGKNYGVPRPRGLYGGGEASVVMRKDWLDALGLPVPKTLDEFTKALRAFKEKDPAGGGKTIPMVAYSGAPSTWAGVSNAIFGNTSSVFYAFGVPNIYRLDKGKPVSQSESPEFRKYVDWLRMAYGEKLIDKDAPVLKSGQAKDKFLAGVAGAWNANTQAMDDANYDKLRKSDPKAELVVIPYLEGPDGKKGVAVTTGYYGLWAIPSSVPKDKVEKLVQFMDYSASEENFAFYKAGIIGYHSSEFKNGVAVRNEDQKKLWASERPDQFVLVNRYDPYIYAGSTNPDLRKKQMEALDAITKVGVENPLQGYNSQTGSKNPDIGKKLESALVKYVVGEGNWDEVQKEVDAVSKNPLTEQVKKELMDQYQEDHKK
ncbi:extracellular solute-binding protein [Paenibacillus roseipurpureus]|uniref:Extracellular solute-binding protein n=1 Tax=Paenibacillus roseopurpureus TaxID=2918901 RepID=A0AA96RLV1_9BACL|nr:extracellular solute-binding protein [Paenibacillus sp. MBLB1832]WNR46070.1 extracellular solute-binding protein [Paenibacillus sp. MBLB1832]